MDEDADISLIDSYWLDRDTLPSNHPVIGKGWRLLGPDEKLAPGDETGCVSLLLSRRYPEEWQSIHPEWNLDLGKTVREVTDPDVEMDALERVFRRKI